MEELVVICVFKSRYFTNEGWKRGYIFGADDGVSHSQLTRSTLKRILNDLIIYSIKTIPNDGKPR